MKEKLQLPQPRQARVVAGRLLGSSSACNGTLQTQLEAAALCWRIEVEHGDKRTGVPKATRHESMHERCCNQHT